jgi:Flp pilus assembly protein TadG
MLINLRRGKKAQSLVIVALSATALFGIIALGLDAGRLYFQRRDVQNAADAGALAGAQELLPPDGNSGVTTAMVAKAGCQAATFALQNLLDTPRDAGCNPPSPNYTPGAPGAGITEPAAHIPATVQVWTPSRGNSNEIRVRVTYNVPLTFASVLGFSSSAVVADAYAHGGFYNNMYAVFGFQAGPGGGNTVEFDQNGYAQIDDGANGQDICNPSSQGRVVSNAKWHAPNPHPGWLNINADFSHMKASDTHALRLYWYDTVNPIPLEEPAPNYEASYSPGIHAATTGGSIGGVPAWYLKPGLWTSTLNIPGSIPGAKATDYFIFENGIYVFQNASLNITGGIVANTSTGRPLPTMGTYSDLPAAADGTDGVEFIFDGSGSFTASTSGSTSPSVFLVAPNVTPSGITNHISFFVRSTDTDATPWTEQIDGTKPTYGGYPFQIWGTVFVNETDAAATLQAVSAWQSPANPGKYAVTGEVVAPRVTLMAGNLANQATINPSVPNGTPGTPGCTGGYVQNPAGLLVQFNQSYAPHFRGYAYLVR